MKRIALFLAAAAALASCVEEKALVPEQTTDNLVTIKALATKTTLGEDGASVVWENNDAIKIVFKGDEDTYETVFTTSLAENASSADFTGIIGDEVTEEAYGTVGFAVYPSTTELGERNGLSRLEFSVASEQDGKIGKDENCSYANISLSDIKAKNTTTASFHNLLSIIKVVVPEGVKSVTVETTEMSVIVIGKDGAGNDIVQSTGFPETPIAGTAPFVYDNDAMELDFNNWADQKTAFNEETSSSYQVDVKLSKVVLKDASNNNLVAGTYDLLVFPGEHDNLKITVEGTNASYEKSIGAFTFEAGRYHNLNLTNIFGLGVNEFFVSPFGGTAELPVTTTIDDYKVNIPAEASWLTITPKAKGAFRKDMFTVTAEENTTGIERSTEVTLTKGETTLATITVSQKGYVPALLGEYKESFVRGTGYATEIGSFEIKKTDDANKGVYIVDGILGGLKVYADYASNVLTCYYGSSKQNFTVSADFAEISATGGVSLGGVTINSYGGKYNAVRAQGAPTLTAEEEALVGTYNESWKYQKSYSSPVEDVTSNNGMMISASDEAAYGRLKVTFLSKGGSYTCYANLSGSSLNVLSSGANHASYGAAQHDIVMSISEGVLSFSSLAVVYSYNYGTISDYTATKVETSGGAVTAEDLIGTWHEEFMAGSSYSSDLMEISATDDASKGQLKVRMFNFVPKYTWQSSYALECYADYDEVSATLTVKSNNVMYNGSAVFGDMPMIVTSDGSTITISFSSMVMVGDSVYGMPLGSITATKL